LAADIDLPLVVENDAHLAAVGEARRGAAQGVTDFVVIAIGTGIGAAAVVDGRLVTGRHNAAGEVGSMVFDRADLARSVPDGLGWLESVASGPAIARSHPPSTTKAVFAAMRSGDTRATEVIEAFLDYLAMAVIAVAAVVDPEVVILEGGVARGLGSAVAGLNDRVHRHLPSPPRIEVSTLQPTAALVGATVAATVRSSLELTGSDGHHPFGMFARDIQLQDVSRA
jgi:glucokinase